MDGNKEVIVVGDSDDESPAHRPQQQRAEQPLLRLVEREGNLFDVADPKVSFAHCVGSDFGMRGGIAKDFRKRYGGQANMRGQNVGVGGCASLVSPHGRYVFALVTKQNSRDRPALRDLRSSLRSLRERMRVNGVTELAIPRLGCGIDRLDWEVQVRPLVIGVFGNTACTITVYHQP